MLRALLSIGVLVAIATPAAAGEPSAGPLLIETPVWESDDGDLAAAPVLLLQPRYELHVTRGATDRFAGSGFALRRGEAGIVAAAFSVFRLKVVGALEGGRGAIADAYVEIDPWAGALALKVGYFKAPYCRQFVASDARRQLADEAMALELVQPHEELGAQLGGLLGGVVEYRLGAWRAADGEFAARTGASADPIVGGRVGVHPFGYLSSDGEPDLEGRRHPGLAVGATALYQRRAERSVALAGLGTVGYDDHRLRLGGEVVGRWRGASVIGEVLYNRVWPVAGTPDTIGARLPVVHGLAAYLQGGYFVLPELLEIAVRMDYLDHDIEIAGQALYPTGGVAVYLSGHQLKLLAFYRLGFAVDDAFPLGSPLHTPVTHELLLGLQLAL